MYGCQSYHNLKYLAYLFIKIDGNQNIWYTKEYQKKIYYFILLALTFGPNFKIQGLLRIKNSFVIFL